MPLWLLLVVMVLAVYRLTRLVTADAILDGPRDRFVYRHSDPDGTPDKLGYMATCPFCVSVYAAAVVTAATWATLNWWGDGLPLPVLVFAGVAGAVSFIYELLPDQ